MTEAEWWEEDAKRVEELGKRAKQLRIIVPVNAGNSPPLDKNGALIDDDATAEHESAADTEADA